MSSERRAELVVTLLSDGVARSTNEIAVALGVEYQRASNTVSSLERRHRIVAWGKGIRRSRSWRGVSMPVTLWALPQEQT
jgi:hypothetical protein